LHLDTLNDTPHSVRLLWTSDQPVTQTSDNTQHSQQTAIRVQAGFEPAFPASEQPQNHNLGPRGHWDRWVFIILRENSLVTEALRWAWRENNERCLLGGIKRL